MKPSAGYSLVEMMAVMAIGAILLGLAVSGSRMSRDHTAPQTAATQFQTLLKEARLLSIKERAPVRLVFIPARLSSSAPPTAAPGDWVECALYVFTIPPAAAREVSWRLPGEQNALRGGDALERIPINPPGLPQELIGQWKRASIRPLRFSSTMDRAIQLDSALLRDFRDKDFPDFAQAYSQVPAQFWSREPAAPWAGYSTSSPYPETYFHTPWPDGPPLVQRPLPASARLYDPQSEAWRPASDFWPSNQVLSHFDLSNPPQLEALPFVEFAPGGRLHFSHSDSLAFTFFLAQRPTHSDSPANACQITLGQNGGFAQAFVPPPPDRDL